MEVQIYGRWAISEEGDLTLVDRHYRNLDSPVASKVVEFIEENIDPTIRFSIFGIPLQVQDFSYDGELLKVELTRE